MGEGVEVSQGLTAKVVSERIADLLGTLRAKAEGPLVSSVGLISSSNLFISSFSNTDFDFLDERLNIFPGNPLVNQGNDADRAAESIAQGGELYMATLTYYYRTRQALAYG